MLRGMNVFLQFINHAEFTSSLQMPENMQITPMHLCIFAFCGLLYFILHSCIEQDIIFTHIHTKCFFKLQVKYKQDHSF